jgi:hypothetical protein
MNGECEMGKANRDLIERIENGIEGLKIAMDKKFDDVWGKIDLLMGRPSWIVTIIISVLATACGSMAVFIVCNAHKLCGS